MTTNTHEDDRTSLPSRAFVASLVVIGGLTPLVLYVLLHGAEPFTSQTVELPHRPAPLFEQFLATVSFFLVKPIYTLMSLVVVIVLWRSRAADLVALRWAMIAFFLGENACAVNYLVFKETSRLMEYSHSFGMLVCFGFVVFALLEGIDHRMLGLSDPERTCAAVRLCSGCVKQDAQSSCGLKRTFLMLIPTLMVIALMLPTADWHDTTYTTTIFGQPYTYGHSRIYQEFENWYCPAAAVVLFSLSLGFLILKRERPIFWGKIAFAAGCGALGFGLLRMLLGAAYDDNRVWFLFWEETTEFLFILAVCLVLTIFRRHLQIRFPQQLLLLVT